MAISLTCSCGKFCRIKDAFAGRRIRCPDCGNVLQVPLTDGNDDAEKEAFDLLLTDSAGDKQAPRTEMPEEAPTALPGREGQQKPGVRTPPEAKPRTKAPPRRSARRPRVVFEQGWFGSLNAGVIGGVLMILIAVVWFAVGLWAGRIFFYPPILVVIGISAIIKGFFSGE